MAQQTARQNSVGPSDLTFLEKRFGPGFMRKKKKDVQLPMPVGGRKDPRLETKFDKIKKGFGVFRKLGEKK